MMSAELRALLLTYINSRGEGKDKLREALLQQSSTVDVRYSSLASVRGESEYTAVHRAVKINDLESLKAMLRGFTPDQQYNVIKIRSRGCKTALHWAAFFGHTDIIKLILSNLSQEQRISILRIQDGDGSTPLHSAANGKHLSELQIMVTSVPLSLHRKFLHVKDNQRMTITEILELPEFPYDVAAWTQLELDATKEKLAAMETEVIQLRADLAAQKEEFAEKHERQTQQYRTELEVTNEKLAAVEAASNQQATIIEQLRVDLATQMEENARFAEKQSGEKQQHTRELSELRTLCERQQGENQQQNQELNAANQRIGALEAENNQFREALSRHEDMLSSQVHKQARVEKMMEQMVFLLGQTVCIGPEMDQEYEADLPYL